MDVKSMSKFQLIFTGVLVLAIVVAVGMFAMNKASNTGGVATVTIWGTIPETTVHTFFVRPEMGAAFRAANVNINYVSKPADSFDQAVVEAVASGKGPDAVLISQDAGLQYLDKTILIPFTSFSERAFKDTYVQESELFLTSQGIEALPFTIDPMVMYWNRTLLANAGIANPPTSWSQIYGPNGIIAKINKVDVNHNILKTAIALGTYNNIYHAKDVLSLLMMQAGSPIVSRNTAGGLVNGLNNSNSATDQNGAAAALSFYTQFADPAKSFYSWNTALPLSRDSFTAGDLALYFGYASELNDIATRNPNLNFDVTSMPQSLTSPISLTYGKVYGLSILKSTQNIGATVKALTVLSSSAAQSIWSNISGYPPVTRDLLSQTPSSPFMSVFYTASLQSQGWLDPNRTATNSIFGNMVTSVLSGSQEPQAAVQDAGKSLNQLFSSVSN